MDKIENARHTIDKFRGLNKPQMDFFLKLSRLEIIGKIYITLSSSVKYLILTTGVVLCVRYLAGKDTKAIIDLAIGLKNVFDITDVIPYIGLFIAGIWTAIERGIRMQTKKNMGERIKHLELALDANRSSSQLNKFGELDERKVK